MYLKILKVCLLHLKLMIKPLLASRVGINQNTQLFITRKTSAQNFRLSELLMPWFKFNLYGSLSRILVQNGKDRSTLVS